MSNPDPSPATRFTTSGNPHGRPKGYREFRELCRTKTEKALRALVRALREPRERVPAAKVLLEFGWGKPSSVELTQRDAEAMADTAPTAEEANAAAERLRARAH